MSKWTAKYDDQQRAAIERAFVDLRLRPISKIVRMAAAGELRPDADAEPLPPFEIPYSSLQSIGRTAERRRRGEELPADLARLPARDRAEQMQRRLTALIDRDLTRMEKEQQRRPKTPVDAEHARKLGRALRELATLPDAHEKRLPRTPGQRDTDGAQPDGPTRDSFAGKLLAASDQSVSPSVRTETTSHPQTDTDRNSEHTNVSTREHDEQQHDEESSGDAPGGSAPREHVSGLVASGVSVG